MFFLYCNDCDDTVRSLDAEIGVVEESVLDSPIGDFHLAHAGCRLTCYVPTGRATSTLPWHEPMAERRIEVSGDTGPALAVGSRDSLDEPLRWRIEQLDLAEHLDVALDRDAFWGTVDRALHPHHIPARAVSQWATRIEEFVRRVPAEDLVFLWDDPKSPNVTHACLTLTSRVSLEDELRRSGFDGESERRLLGAFEDPEFPLLAVKRTLTQALAAR